MLWMLKVHIKERLDDFMEKTSHLHYLKKKDSNFLSHKLLDFWKSNPGKCQYVLCTVCSACSLPDHAPLVTYSREEHLYLSSSTAWRLEIFPGHGRWGLVHSSRASTFSISKVCALPLKPLCQRWAPISYLTVLDFSSRVQKSHRLNLAWCHTPEQALLSICVTEVLKELQDKHRDAFNVRRQRTNPLGVNSTPRAQAAELSDKENERDDMIVAH